MNARKSDGFPQVNDPPAPPVEMMYLMPALAQALTFALMKAETWYEPQASDVHDPPAKAHVTVVIPVPASADIDRHVLVRAEHERGSRPRRLCRWCCWCRPRRCWIWRWSTTRRWCGKWRSSRLWCGKWRSSRRWCGKWRTSRCGGGLARRAIRRHRQGGHGQRWRRRNRVARLRLPRETSCWRSLRHGRRWRRSLRLSLSWAWRTLTLTLTLPSWLALTLASWLSLALAWPPALWTLPLALCISLSLAAPPTMSAVPSTLSRGSSSVSTSATATSTVTASTVAASTVTASTVTASTVAASTVTASPVSPTTLRGCIFTLAIS